jgi:hypothetical protein
MTMSICQVHFLMDSQKIEKGGLLTLTNLDSFKDMIYYHVMLRLHFVGN